MAHGDAREEKWRVNRRMEWVASTLNTTSEHGVSSITTADADTSAASSRLNWRPRRFKWTRPFRRKTKSGFCACAIIFQLASTNGRADGSKTWINDVDGQSEWTGTKQPTRNEGPAQNQFQISTCQEMSPSKPNIYGGRITTLPVSLSCQFITPRALRSEAPTPLMPHNNWFREKKKELQVCYFHCQ